MDKATAEALAATLRREMPLGWRVDDIVECRGYPPGTYVVFVDRTNDSVFFREPEEWDWLKQRIAAQRPQRFPIGAQTKLGQIDGSERAPTPDFFRCVWCGYASDDVRGFVLRRSNTPGAYLLYCTKCQQEPFPFAKVPGKGRERLKVLHGNATESEGNDG